MDLLMELDINSNDLDMDFEVNETIKGDDGKSAYQIALDNGFEGTEQEWLDSLKGADGESYNDTELRHSVTTIEEDVLYLKAITSSLEGESLFVTDRVTSLESTIGTLNDSLEGVLNGN